ncbi:MAG: hypothetical protein K2X06_02650 [Burkholderiales bacterium]|nr:hypothetical protein [Burkholderiales bacterium]
MRADVLHKLLGIRLDKALLCAGLMVVLSVAAAEKAGDYGAKLREIYFAHQRLLALREACDQALPAQAKAGEKAYAAWQARHKALLNELDARLTLMIRGASKDEKEYMRNVGKYEGAILEYRNDKRDELLAQPRDGMEQFCADFRNYLTGSGSDFRKEYAEELRELRKRKLPQ